MKSLNIHELTLSQHPAHSSISSNIQKTATMKTLRFTPISKIIVSVSACLAFASSAFGADEYHYLREEMRQMRQEIRELRQDVSDLKRIVSRNHNPRDPYRPHVDPSYGGKAWGCYMQDMKAGGVYGTGRTEAEAKGRALEQCTQRNGVCFETGLKCSRD